MEEQYIKINNVGDKFYYSDKAMTVLHREDGPAIEDGNGNKYWYINSKLHREAGPAVEWAGGYKAWYINSKLHREDGPAIEWTSGSKAWYINGKLHREDGPANEWTVGGNEWWVDGKRLTEEEFNLQMSPIELTLDEIAEKFGVSVDKLKIKA